MDLLLRTRKHTPVYFDVKAARHTWNRASVCISIAGFYIQLL